MILQGLSADILARLMSLDRPGDHDSWLLFGPSEVFAVQAPDPEVDSSLEPLRWAAE